MLEPLWQICEQIDDNILSQQQDYAFYISLTMHLSGMIERILIIDTLTANEEELSIAESTPF